MVQELTIEQVKGRLDAGESFHLVDVRENDEWAQGHIHGARHIPKGSIERDISGAVPQRSDTVILYCAGGMRSAAAAEMLQRLGYEHVFSMKGGIKAWAAGQLPVER